MFFLFCQSSCASSLQLSMAVLLPPHLPTASPALLSSSTRLSHQEEGELTPRADETGSSFPRASVWWLVTEKADVRPECTLPLSKYYNCCNNIHKKVIHFFQFQVGYGRYSFFCLQGIVPFSWVPRSVWCWWWQWRMGQGRLKLVPSGQCAQSGNFNDLTYLPLPVVCSKIALGAWILQWVSRPQNSGPLNLWGMWGSCQSLVWALPWMGPSRGSDAGVWQPVSCDLIRAEGNSWSLELRFSMAQLSSPYLCNSFKAQRKFSAPPMPQFLAGVLKKAKHQHCLCACLYITWGWLPLLLGVHREGASKWFPLLAVGMSVNTNYLPSPGKCLEKEDSPALATCLSSPHVLQIRKMNSLLFLVNQVLHR